MPPLTGLCDRKMMETPSVVWRFANHSLYPNTRIQIVNPDKGLNERDITWVATEHIRAGDMITYMFKGCEDQEHMINSPVLDPPRVPNQPPISARGQRKRAREERMAE